MQVQSLGQDDPLKKEMETHCSILAWEIPWTEEPGRLHLMRLQRVRHDLMTNNNNKHLCTDFCVDAEAETPVLWPPDVKN